MYECGVSFEHPHGVGRHGISSGSSLPRQAPAHLPDIHCRLPKPMEAVSTHYRALGHAAVRQPLAPLGVESSGDRPMSGLPGILDAAGRWLPMADHTLARLPRAAWWQVISLRCWYRSRTRHSQIQIWCSTTELTVTHGSATTRSEAIHGTHAADRLNKGQGNMRRWPSHIILSKRRRWESNPQVRGSRPCRYANLRTRS